MLLAAVAAAMLFDFLSVGETAPRLYDFHTFWLAGRDRLRGRDPYPAEISGRAGRGDWVVYPVPAAALFAPLRALP